MFFRNKEASVINNFPQTAEAWKHALRSEFRLTEHQLDNLANHMLALALGQLYVQKHYREHGSFIRLPKIRIWRKKTSSVCSCSNDGKFLNISKEYLERMSNFDCDNVIQTFSKLDELLFQGAVWQRFVFAGIEETDHSALIQVGDPMLQLYPRAHEYAKSKVEYDANPFEFHALALQLLFATEYHFSQETLDVLLRRIEAVKMFLHK